MLTKPTVNLLLGSVDIWPGFKVRIFTVVGELCFMFWGKEREGLAGLLLSGIIRLRNTMNYLLINWLLWKNLERRKENGPFNHNKVVTDVALTIPKLQTNWAAEHLSTQLLTLRCSLDLVRGHWKFNLYWIPSL